MNIQNVNFTDKSFVLVTKPTDFELKYLKSTFGFDSLHLEDYLNRTQVPKIETFKEYTLVVLDFPYFHQHAAKKEEKGSTYSLKELLSITQVPLATVSISPLLTHGRKKRIHNTQVYFFINKTSLVIIHEGYLTPISDIFIHIQKTLHNREEYMAKGPVYLLYRIIDALVDANTLIMNDLSSIIEKIDRELQEKHTHTIIEEVSITRRNIVVFHTMIKPILPLFKQLEDGKYVELNGEMQQYWSNVHDHLLKIWDRLEDSQELIEGIAESYESLLTAKTNTIVMILTVFSAILLPLNLLASMYGMNIVGLPYAQQPFALFFILLLMTVTAVGLLLYFRYKKII